MYRVFLVEDEPPILKNLILKIERLALDDFIIQGVASSAEEAWDKIQEDKPDFIISDIKMVGKDGLWLFEQIRHKYGKNIICVALSAYNDFDCLQKCIRIGIDDYILKPISIMQLKEKFEEIEATLKEQQVTQSDMDDMTQSKNTQSKNTMDICDQIDCYIENNYKEKIQLEQLSQVFSYSVQYLCEVYKKKRGITVGDAITNAKLNKAIEMMEEDNTISTWDIADLVGYNDYRYFTRVFKKKTGMTVKEFKSQLESKTDR